MNIRREVRSEVESANELVILWSASGWGQVPLLPRLQRLGKVNQSDELTVTS